ncbi:MAG: trypsin-like peptidase domain-containing protein [Bdellovibrionales bacterium]|nr:trypsin-like peptidase domain-containing protein [Bdellovibrionales bacterium]
MKLSNSFVVLAAALSTASAFALPLAPRDYAENAKHLSAALDGYNFDGIVALNNCSGSLVRFQTSLADENAMVLTNGHCLANAMGGGMPKPGVVIVDQAANRTMNLLDPSTGSKIGDVHATKILYATMTGTDVTLYLLKETYAEIENGYKIHALTLANRYPAVGEGIDVISGYWKRGYSCKVDGIVHELREAGWSMKDSIRYSRPGCETIGGTSGSPIISLDTKEVVGVNNTGNENGEKCTMDNPCEVDERGTITYQKGLSYGQQISWFYSCLTDDRKIDLNKAGCLLAKPSSAPAPTPPRDEPKGSFWPKKSRLN